MSKPPKELTYGSLFSGIGGIDLGLDRAGWRGVFQVETDPYCLAVLRKHWPDVPKYTDVRTVGAELPRVDLLAGGFPCQPVSLAGRRRGAADERWLWPEFARLVRLLRPRYVLVENVPGILSTYHRCPRCGWIASFDPARRRCPDCRLALVVDALATPADGVVWNGMAEVLGDLAALGLDAEWDCIPAAVVGAPHLRYRIFLVAHASGDQLWNQPGRSCWTSWESAALVRDDGETGSLAYAKGFGQKLRPAERERSRRSSGSGDKCCPDVGDRDQGLGQRRGEYCGKGYKMADAGRNGRKQGAEVLFRREPIAALRGENGGGWWATEPDVGRVAAGLSAGLDGDLGAHESCFQKARSASVPQTGRLRVLRHHLATPEASSEPRRCHLCGHPLSALSCQGACRPWYLGARVEEAEDVRCMREGVLELLTRQGEDLRACLSFGSWSSECDQAVGRRVDRLRALGNAVVPQVAEAVGRQIVRHALGR